MPSAWMTLGETREYLLPILTDDGSITASLRAYLVRKEIRCRADRLVADDGLPRRNCDPGEYKFHGAVPFWECAEIDFAQSRAVIASDFPDPFGDGVWSPPERPIEAIGVTLHREDVERIWPRKLVQRRQDSTKSLGGSPGRWDWEGAYIEMARVAFVDQTFAPASNDAKDIRAELNKRVAQWFIDQSDDQPSPSQIRDKVKRFYETIYPPET